MATTLDQFRTTFGQASAADLTLAALCLLAALGLYALQLRHREKGAAVALSLGKWLAALAALAILDQRVLGRAFYGAVYAAYCLIFWLAFRVLLHDLYAGLYLTRLKGQAPNKLLLNLLSFLAALVLVGAGLRGVFQVDVGSLLTSSAILTAVVGFSMQDTIGSLFSGLLIQTEKPFVVGDWIKVGDQEGQVSEITWRYTKLTTFSQNQVLIPNNIVAKGQVVNISRPIPQVSVTVPVPAPLSAPPVKIKSALEEVLRKSPLVAGEPAPRVRLAEIGLDQITYRLVFHVNDYNDTVAARSEVLSAAWYEFRKQGVEFPVSRQMLVRGRGNACSGVAEAARLVGGLGLFAGMRPEELELLADCAALRTYLPGSRIVERGQTGTTMFLITSGQVAVSRDDRELTRLGPGEVFGEMALLTGEPRQADVTALEPVACLEVDREAFRGVLEKNPVLVANVNRVFQEREASIRREVRRDGEDSAEGLFERFRRIFW